MVVQNKTELERIAQAIRTAGTVAILPHISADGDAVGSSLGLALALSHMGKHADVFLEENISYVFSFLPGRELSHVYTEEDAGKRFDMVIAADCGDENRMGRRSVIFNNSSATANIDHHPTNTGFAGFNYVDSTASATAEIIFDLIGILGAEYSTDVATCLYVGIATDTGCFKYSNTTPRTHIIASELIEKGHVDVADISQKVFESISYERVRLTGVAINSLELFEDGKIAVMTITNEALRSIGAKDEDCDGIINIARDIRGVEAAAMLRQLDNGDIKVNLRSNYYADVSTVAAMHLGGGHMKAAGYTTNGSLDEAKSILVDDLRKLL